MLVLFTNYDEFYGITLSIKFRIANFKLNVMFVNRILQLPFRKSYEIAGTISEAYQSLNLLSAR